MKFLKGNRDCWKSQETRRDHWGGDVNQNSLLGLELANGALQAKSW